MKKFSVVLMFLFAGLFAAAQSLVDSDKQWSNLKGDYVHWPSFSTEFIRFTVDTLVDGVLYKKVEQSNDEGQINWTPYGFIREEPGKKVYYRLSGTEPERIFYDFGLHLYDTLTAWTINTFNNSQFIQPQTYFVVSVDSILIGDHYRKQINLGVPEDSSFVLEHWIDSTGNLGGILHNNNMMMGRDSYQLQCYSEGAGVLYPYPGFDSCFVVAGVADAAPLASAVRIIPNPLTYRSLLRADHYPATEEKRIEFIDPMGRVVFSTVFREDLQLKRSDFLPGVYLFRLTSASGGMLSGKLVVH